MKKIYLFSTALFLAVGFSANAQTAPVGCLDVEFPAYGQVPNFTYVPECTGVNETVAEHANLREYSMVEVTAGVEYTFSLSATQFYVTIGDEAGENVLAGGVGSVTWTPDFSGNVRFYSHYNADCGLEYDSDIDHKRLIRCGEAPAAPTDCTDFAVPSNGLEGNQSFSKSPLAIDIPVGDQAFTIYGIRANLLGEATTFDFVIYSDAGNGFPGEEIDTREGSLVSSQSVGTSDYSEYVISFDEPLDLEANTTYWIGLNSDAEGWETTSKAEDKIGADDTYLYSEDAGLWIGVGKSLVFSVICSDPLGLDDVEAPQIAYYPNPVTDVLNFSSVENVKSVTIYNMAGQKISDAKQLTNNQINMSSYAPGTYIVTVTLESGKTQSLKVIKK